ncbi:Hypothetical predicted protein [Mytilus galloprovincialis]|uniref:Uncharacterized protein n=1 Tax=Mytilus galloprovincialis TaxID=29158 RepID=A0A8B6HGF7_MYTGA|nr:Hypothetical predicted protein [Mytilus galloprovincialis]
MISMSPVIVATEQHKDVPPISPNITIDTSPSLLNINTDETTPLQNINIDGTTPLQNVSVDQCTIQKPPSSASNTTNNTTRTDLELKEIKQSELRQRELKLRKKEEELKIRERIIEETQTEKIWFQTYINKLEQRVKELERSNEILRKHSNLLNVPEPTNQTVNKDSSQAPSQNQNVQTNSSNIQLLGNIQDRVSNFILRQIDDQLVKLEDSFIKSSQSPSYQGTNLSPDQSQTREFQQQIPPQFNVNHQHLTMNPTCIPPNRMNTINSSTNTSRSRSNDIGVNRTLSGQTIYYSPPSYMTPKYQDNVPPGIQAVSTYNQKTPYMHPHYNSALPSTVQTKICVEPHPLTHHNQHTWQGSQQNSSNQNILRKDHFLGHSQPQYSRR